MVGDDPRSLSRSPAPPARSTSRSLVARGACLDTAAGEPWPPELVSCTSPGRRGGASPWPPEALYVALVARGLVVVRLVGLEPTPRVCDPRVREEMLGEASEFVPVRATPRRTAHTRLCVASEQHDVGVPSRAPPGVVDFAEHVRSGRPKDVGVAGRAGRRQRPVRGLVERVDQQRVVGSRAEGVVADLPVFPRVQDVPAVSFEKRVVGEPPFHGEHGRVRDERLQRPLGVHVDVEVEAALPRDDRQPEQIRAHHDARRGLVRLEDPRPRVCARHVFPRGGVVEKYALEAGAGRFESSSEVRVDVGRRPRRLEDAPRDARRLRRERPFRPGGAGRRSSRPPSQVRGAVCGRWSPTRDARRRRGRRRAPAAAASATPSARRRRASGCPSAAIRGLPRYRCAKATLRGGPGSLAGADFIKSSYN